MIFGHYGGIIWVYIEPDPAAPIVDNYSTTVLYCGHDFKIVGYSEYGSPKTPLRMLTCMV